MSNEIKPVTILSYKRSKLNNSKLLFLALILGVISIILIVIKVSITYLDYFFTRLLYSLFVGYFPIIAILFVNHYVFQPKKFLINDDKIECTINKEITFSIFWSEFKNIEIIKELYMIGKKSYLNDAIRFNRGDEQRILSLYDFRKEAVINITQKLRDYASTLGKILIISDIIIDRVMMDNEIVKNIDSNEIMQDGSKLLGYYARALDGFAKTLKSLQNTIIERRMAWQDSNIFRLEYTLAQSKIDKFEENHYSNLTSFKKTIMNMKNYVLGCITIFFLFVGVSFILPNSHYAGIFRQIFFFFCFVSFWIFILWLIALITKE